MPPTVKVLVVQVTATLVTAAAPTVPAAPLDDHAALRGVGRLRQDGDVIGRTVAMAGLMVKVVAARSGVIW